MQTKPRTTQLSIKARKIVYFLFSVLEILFIFRLIFKGLGANPESQFVSIIYSVTGFFLTPFEGIFSPAVTEGIETQGVIEPHLIIGMVAYAVLAWGIVKLIEIGSRQRTV